MHLKARLVAGVLAVSFLGAGRAPAMDILFFARMALDDQADYVTSLVVGSARMLRTTGHADEAQKAIALFKDPSKNGGVSQMAKMLKQLQAKNTLNTTLAKSRGPAYDVEAAMQLTLRQNGIEVPLKYLEMINKNFAPQLPMRPHV
ncbi:MAG TPA: hypothetical protein VHY09_10070 [Candidatus Methylacidiphilales bacterium]|nr:hypothetical protein [Candidatus Methylacidiphilales bacterium]